MLIETFTKKKPKDEMFTEGLTLKCWIQESIPDSITQVIDVRLMQLEDNLVKRDDLVKRKIACISSILQLLQVVQQMFLMRE